MAEQGSALAHWALPAPNIARRAGVEERVVTLLQPSSLEADQYRLLRWELEQRQRSQGVAVVAVSSPGVGDGKTTTAVNLAGALSQDPRARVLIVDADLRRPAVSGRLGLVEGRDDVGLAGALLDANRTLASVVRPRPPFNLSVLPAGRTHGVPFELLRSPRLGELLAEARRHYDFVVVDTPPLVLLPDCRAVSQWVDGFVLVVAARRTPRSALAAALSALDESKALGIVFNGEERPPSLYYHRYYTDKRRRRDKR